MNLFPKMSVVVLLGLLTNQTAHAYKNVPFVHDWVAFQAWKIVRDPAAKAEIGQYLWTGNIPDAANPYPALFGSAPYNPGMNLIPLWEDEYSVPAEWRGSPTDDGNSIFEGAWEEDEDHYVFVYPA